MSWFKYNKVVHSVKITNITVQETITKNVHYWWEKYLLEHNKISDEVEKTNKLKEITDFLVMEIKITFETI